jgi:hypothetical protein
MKKQMKIEREKALRKEKKQVFYKKINTT